MPAPSPVFGLAAARAAMIEVHQNLQRVAHQLVGFLALHVDDEAEAAGVVLKLRIVKSLFRRRGNQGSRVPFISYFCIVLLVIVRRISLRSLYFLLNFTSVRNKCFQK